MISETECHKPTREIPPIKISVLIWDNFSKL